MENIHTFLNKFLFWFLQDFANFAILQKNPKLLKLVNKTNDPYISTCLPDMTYLKITNDNEALTRYITYLPTYLHR